MVGRNGKFYNCSINIDYYYRLTFIVHSFFNRYILFEFQTNGQKQQQVCQAQLAQQQVLHLYDMEKFILDMPVIRV